MARLVIGLVLLVAAEIFILPHFIGPLMVFIVPITVGLAIWWGHRMAGPIPILEEEMTVRVRTGGEG
jgi:hypothetical protein